MHIFSLLTVEAKRIFLSKVSWVMALVTICTPLAGYLYYTPAAPSTQSAALIANPTLAGGLLGAVFFAILALYELNRIQKNDIAVLTDSMVSPMGLNMVRLVALLIFALATVAIASLVYLPYTMFKMKHILDMAVYFKCFFLIMLPSVGLGVLFAVIFYQITQRVDIGFVLFAALIMLSLSPWFRDYYLLRWVNPLVPILSDDFSNAKVLRMITYNRLCWYTLAFGVYALAVLCTRKYGKGLLRSLAVNSRKVYFPVIALLLLGIGGYAYYNQPYLDHSPGEVVNEPVELSDNLWLNSTYLDVTIEAAKGKLHGKAVFSAENSSKEPQKCSAHINPGYQVENIWVNGKPVAFEDLNNDCNNDKEIIFEVPAELKLEIVIAYGGRPQEWYFSREYLMGADISKNYVDLGGTEFSPMLYISQREEDVPITGHVTLPESFTFIPTGATPVLVETDQSAGTKTWSFQNTGRTISLFAGDYVMEQIKASSDMYIEFYYSRKHEEIMNKIKAKETLAEVVEYCTQHYGPLDFSFEQPLKLIQGTAYMQGGQAYDNFSVMGEGYFSEENLKDSEKGASNQEVLAHEITHQWWGLFRPVMDMDTWSSEGLTVYTTYRMAKEKYGAEYAQKNYVDKWKENQETLERSFYQRNPDYISRLPEKYQGLIASTAFGINYYSILPLQLLKAANLLGGEEQLDRVLSKLYLDGGTEMPPYITMQDFLAAAGLTKEDIQID